MAKKLSLILISLLLILTGVSCNNQEEETVQIGVILSTSGLLGPMGERMMNGARLAVDEINADGGVLGKQLELIEENDNTESAKCLERVKKLVEVDGVKLMVGGMTSGASMASGAYLAEQGALMISPSATSPELSGQAWRDNYTRVVPSDAFQGAVLAQIIMEEGFTKLATVVQDNPYGIGLETALLDALAEQGWEGENVVSIHFDPTKLDYRTELGQVQMSEPDVVLAVTYAEDGIILFKQANEMGLDNIAWLGCDGNYGSGLFEEPSAAAFMEKALIAGTRAAGPSGDTYNAFATAYEEAYGEPAEVYCDTCYDAVKMLAAAIEQAGTTDTEAVRAALLEIGQDYDGASGTITFDELGDRVSGTFEVWVVEKDEEGAYHNVSVRTITL